MEVVTPLLMHWSNIFLALTHRNINKQHGYTHSSCDTSFLGPIYQHGLLLIPGWRSNYIHYKMWDEIAYPFPNFNCAAVEVWEWISKFIPYFIQWQMFHHLCIHLFVFYLVNDHANDQSQEWYVWYTGNKLLWISILTDQLFLSISTFYCLLY